MRVCCLIDSFNSGGAQRQMAMLIRLLAIRGHDVHVVTYYDYDHYLPLLREVGVRPVVVQRSTPQARITAVRKEVRRAKPDAILSYLSTPGMLAVLSALPPKRIPVVVSERSLNVGRVALGTRARFHLYRWSDRIVANSQSQAEFIKSTFRFLAPKVRVILNCVDTDQFIPSTNAIPSHTGIRIVVAASVTAIKNALSLIAALRIVKDSGHQNISVDWYGNNLLREGEPTRQSEYYIRSRALIDRLELTEQFRFHEARSDIHAVYPDYDACCLPSMYEGFPNAICEAMACGLPVLASDIGDIRRLVPTEEHGFRFNPNDPNDIARSILAYASLSADERKAMSVRNRSFAVNELGQQRFLMEYETLLAEIAL